VGGLLEGVLGEAKFRQVERQLRLEAEWPRLIGERLAPFVRVVALLGDTLWLETEGPAFSQEAQLRSGQLMDSANRLLEDKVINQVRVRQARSAASIARNDAAAPKAPLANPDDGELERVKDPELRALLQRLRPRGD
jgi:hypothetical protein